MAVTVVGYIHIQLVPGAFHFEFAFLAVNWCQVHCSVFNAEPNCRPHWPFQHEGTNSVCRICSSLNSRMTTALMNAHDLIMAQQFCTGLID